MELYWSYTGVVILLFNAFACICQWGCAGGRSPAAGCRRPKDGAGQRPGVAGLEFLGLARCVGFAGWKRSSPEAQPKRGQTKIPKIPKIPIALDDSGELKQLP